ncbi:MAG TPA: hypothetical protein VL175_06845 [Pirellulales bacterium]|jgi:hypothetical protein|nr:hypothetical protein [Pirellulales bacterium]
MSHDLIAVHKAALETVKRKKAELQSELHTLDLVERYHQRELSGLMVMQDIQARVDAASGEAPPVSRESRLYGKTIAEAAEYALAAAGACRAGDIADMLQSLGYGTGSGNRSYVNAIYNAMSRKPDMFVNREGVWSLKSREATHKRLS